MDCSGAVLAVKGGGKGRGRARVTALLEVVVESHAGINSGCLPVCGERRARARAASEKSLPYEDDFSQSHVCCVWFSGRRE